MGDVMRDTMTLEAYRDAVYAVLDEVDCLDGEEVHAENLRPYWEAGMTPHQAAAEEIEPGPVKSDWVQAIADNCA